MKIKSIDQLLSHQKAPFPQKGSIELSAFDCFTRFLGPGRSLVLRVWVTHPGLVSCPFHIPTRQGFLQSFKHWLIPRVEAFCLGIPGFGVHWEHPWPYSAAQKQSWDKVITRPVQSCKILMDSSCWVFCCTHSSKQSIQHSLSLERDWQKRGWKHSRGSDQFINHPFTTWPWCPSLSEQPSVARKPHGPSSCWAVSPANAGDSKGRSKAFSHYSKFRQELHLTLVTGLVISPSVTEQGVSSPCQTQPQRQAAPSSAEAEDGFLKCKVLWECLCYWL